MHKVAEYIAWKEKKVRNPETGNLVKVKSLPQEQQKQYAPKNMVHLIKQKLNNVLNKGTYSIISAGRNPSHEKEGKMPANHKYFAKRHEKLRNDLEKANMKYTEVMGVYDGEEPSFLVLHKHNKPLNDKTVKSMMVHHKGSIDDIKKIHQLAEKYNQDSVLHSNRGKNTLVFTSGKKRGKKCGGHGHKEIPEATNYYTDIPLEKDNHTKVQMDISDCFEKGLL